MAAKRYLRPSVSQYCLRIDRLIEENNPNLHDFVVRLIGLSPADIN